LFERGPPKNLLKLLSSFHPMYNDNFWGNKTAGNTKEDNQERQEILRDFIQYTIDQGEKSIALQILFQSAFTIYPRRDEEIFEEGINKKIPCYYGEPYWGTVKEIERKKELINKFREELFCAYNREDAKNIEYPANEKDEIFKKSFSANIAAITPYYSYLDGKFNFQGLMGFINTAGLNFESTDTADYKKYLVAESGDFKKCKYVQKDIFLITEFVIFASCKLAKDHGYFKAYPLIPLFGLGCFSNYCIDKEKLVDFYVEGLYKACKKYSGKEGIEIIPVFFNIGNNKNQIEKQNKDIKQQENLNDNISEWHHKAYNKYFSQSGEQLISHYMWGSLFDKGAYPEDLDLKAGLITLCDHCR
jgi:hypothetical protein